MKKLLLLVFIISACKDTKPLKINGIDLVKFKNDRGGCNGNRINAKNILEKNRDILLSTEENQIFATFGRYDYQILDKKNEKQFVYFLEKGEHCKNIQNPTTAHCMILSFNSVSLVKEVNFKKGNP
jgi:hypothetical protein